MTKCRIAVTKCTVSINMGSNTTLVVQETGWLLVQRDRTMSGPTCGRTSLTTSPSIFPEYAVVHFHQEALVAVTTVGTWLLNVKDVQSRGRQHGSLDSHVNLSDKCALTSRRGNSLGKARNFSLGRHTVSPKNRITIRQRREAQDSSVLALFAGCSLSKSDMDLLRCSGLHSWSESSTMNGMVGGNGITHHLQLPEPATALGNVIQNGHGQPTVWHQRHTRSQGSQRRHAQAQWNYQCASTPQQAAS